MLRRANVSQMLMQKLWRCVRGKQSLCIAISFSVLILDKIFQYLALNVVQNLSV